MQPSITVHELKKKLSSNEHFILLDVRTIEEREIAKIVPSVWIVLDDLEVKYNTLDKNKDIIVYCHHGSRSDAAAAFLRDKGFNAVSLSGGIDAWSEKIDSSAERY